MISEVATTLRGVAWQPRGPLRERDIGQEVKEALRILHQLATQAPAPASLTTYIKESFEELLA
jgi:hypothetical protein